MSKLRLAGFAGLLIMAALVGGTIIGSVAATTIPRGTAPGSAPGQVALAAAASPKAAAIAEYCAAFRKAFADKLGVQESALAPAAKAAAIATIDAAVADRTMRKAAGDRLKTRIEAADADGCALLAGRIGAARVAAGALGAVRDGISAAAKALGMTPAELGAQLRAGESLKDVAGAKHVPYETVSAAVIAAVKAKVDAAVAAGTIKQARADRILARLARNLADGRVRNPKPAAPAASGAPSTGG